VYLARGQIVALIDPVFRGDDIVEHVGKPDQQPSDGAD